jgi:phage terminase large subunit-like protein
LDDLRDIAPHVATAIRYAEQIRDGEIAACKLTRLACLRFLSDLHREWDYCLDTYEAERACEFFESLPRIKGEWAKRGELLILEPWQCFVVVNVFGWRDESGLRRFRTVYIEVARKNAKSTLAAAIGLFMLIEDGEEGAEVYSAATTRDQAKIVFNTARQMAMRTTALPLEVRTHNINFPDTASLFQALHAQGNTLDGYNIHCAINDELHAWTKRTVYDVLETATGSRLQPLMFNITTAGVEANGVCWDTRQYVARILDDNASDERVFGIIYTLDKNDDWTNEDNWIKANPNLGVSVYVDDLRAQAAKASEIVSQQNAFLTKRMNVWTSSAIAWMNMRAWNKCFDETMSLDDFAGEACWGGLDVASKIDITSGCQLFKRDIDGEEHLFAFMRHWLPETTVQDEPTGIYDGWVRDGLIRTTPGNIIDTDQIETDVFEEIVGPFDLREMGVDPMHNSTQISVHLAQQGVTTVDVRPSVLNFSEPMKWLEAFVKDERFHTNCPVLTWMVSNVEVKVDFKDNIYPRKSGPNKKIDGVIALLIAINRAMADDAAYFPGDNLVMI